MAFLWYVNIKHVCDSINSDTSSDNNWEAKGCCFKHIFVEWYHSGWFDTGSFRLLICVWWTNTENCHHTHFNTDAQVLRINMIIPTTAWYRTSQDFLDICIIYRIVTALIWFISFFFAGYLLYACILLISDISYWVPLRNISICV